MNGRSEEKKKEQWSTKCHCSSCRFFRRRAKDFNNVMSNKIALEFATTSRGLTG
jgi:hypothetical protein